MGVWCGKDAALRLLWGDGGVKNAEKLLEVDRYQGYKDWYPGINTLDQQPS